jgi:hypothetical protein
MAQHPLYTTSGDWAGLLVDGYLYNTQGEWIGWVDQSDQVFTVSGEYVGWLSKDFRVLCKRDTDATLPRRRPPAQPPLRVPVPTSVPLPPLMAELTFDIVDVFDERPGRLYTLDADPTAQDID